MYRTSVLESRIVSMLYEGYTISCNNEFTLVNENGSIHIKLNYKSLSNKPQFHEIFDVEEISDIEFIIKLKNIRRFILEDDSDSTISKINFSNEYEMLLFYFSINLCNDILYNKYKSELTMIINRKKEDDNNE